MATNYNSPGVFLVEKAGATGIPTVSAVNASTLAISGKAKKGSHKIVTICKSMADFERVYGGQIADSDMYLVLKAFFQNGGSRAAVLRHAESPITRVSVFNDNATTPGAAFKFHYKSGGVWANNFKVSITKSAENGAANTDVDITISSKGTDEGGDDITYVDLETFTGVSLTYTDNADGTPNFWTRVVNENTSQYLSKVEDVRVSDVALVTYSATAVDEDGTIVSGDDGNARTETNWDDNYITDYSSPFDAVLENMLFVDCDYNTGTALAALEDYASWRGDGFVIATSEATDTSVSDAVEFRKGSDFPGSTRGGIAMYYPYIQIFDNLRKENRYITPVGHVAGVYARTDAFRNIGKAPAGVADGQLVGLSDLGMGTGYENMQLKRNDLDTLYKGKVNPLLSDPVVGMAVWGARTTSTVDEWKYIQARRLFMFVEQSVKNSVQWVVFENNSPDLWTKIKMQIGGFLSNLFADGYFAGATPADAYYVVCDETNNSSYDQSNGLLNVDIGMAPNKPAEFVVLRFQQKTLTT